MSNNQNLKIIYIKIDKEVYKMWKLIAAEKDMFMKDVLESLIKNYYDYLFNLQKKEV